MSNYRTTLVIRPRLLDDLILKTKSVDHRAGVAHIGSFQSYLNTSLAIGNPSSYLGVHSKPLCWQEGVGFNYYTNSEKRRGFSSFLCLEKKQRRGFAGLRTRSSTDEAKQIRAAFKEGQPMSGLRPPTVLTVFAAEDRRTAFGQVLQQAGFQVHSTASGAEALHLALAEIPDVILLDLDLPDMSGFEVCCRLKSHKTTALVPVLHLSDGPFEDMDFTGHLEQGDEAYLTHPVNDAELLACVRTLFRERQTQQQFHSFLEAAPDAVVICNLDGQIVQANGQAEQMFGYLRQELVGQPIEILVPHRFRDPHSQRRANYSACPNTRPMGVALDLLGLRKDGSEFPVEINLSPLPGIQEMLVASIIRDVTERKRLEQELRDVDRMKNNFLAMLAHELRNPLSTVQYAEQLLRLKVPQTPEVAEVLESIDQQLGLMTRLVEDLSEISLIATGKLKFRPERVDLSALMLAVAKACAARIEEDGHRLTVKAPAEPLYLAADPARLTQVFSNLLNNAAKYTERGGEIWFTAESQEDEVVVSVRDTGVGISPEMLGKVFDCFTQVDGTIKMAKGGLGIGLSLVKGWTERHGGSVQARSDGLGQGSEFLVRLPLLIALPLEDRNS